MNSNNLQDKDVKVWLMQMSDKTMAKRTLSWAEIDAKTVELLEQKNIRLTKQSAFTPSGIFKVRKKGNNLLRRTLDKAREKFAAKEKGPRTEFFEMKYTYEEFRDLYNKVGGLQNTFPTYFKTKEAYEAYAKTHDIWVIEDAKTNEPIGFFSQGLYEKGSDDHKELEEDFGIKIDRPVLYLDTLAIDNSRIGQNLGKMITDIADGYYFNILNSGEFKDKNYTPMLVTGEINQVKGMDLSRLEHIGKLSKEVHAKRGFEVVAEVTTKAGKYVDRDAYFQEEEKKHNLTQRSLFMAQSYSRES